MHSAVFTSICPPCNDYPDFSLGELFFWYNRYSHNPKSRVRPHSCQPSTKGGSSKNLKHSLCLELCHSDTYHEDPCRTCFLPQVCPGSPTSFGRPRRRSWGHTRIRLDSWPMNVEMCWSPDYIYIYMCVYLCVLDIHTYIHTYITYIHTYHCIALHTIALHCIALHYITLHTIT